MNEQSPVEITQAILFLKKIRRLKNKSRRPSYVLFLETGVSQVQAVAISAAIAAASACLAVPTL